MSRIETLRQELHTSIDACADEHILNALHHLLEEGSDAYAQLPEAVKVGLAKSAEQAKQGQLKTLEVYRQERAARRANG